MFCSCKVAKSYSSEIRTDNISPIICEVFFVVVYMRIAFSVTMISVKIDTGWSDYFFQKKKGKFKKYNDRFKKRIPVLDLQTYQTVTSSL